MSYLDIWHNKNYNNLNKILTNFDRTDLVPFNESQDSSPPQSRYSNIIHRGRKRPLHGLINYIDTKAKCSHLQKFTCKGTSRQVFIFLRPSPLLGFARGGLAILFFLNLVWFRVLNFCRILSPTGLNTPHRSQPHTVCSVYTELWHREEGVG